MSPPDDIAPDEAGCRLFLIGPAAPDPEPFAAALDGALAGGGVAGFLMRAPPGDADAVAGLLQPVCRRQGVAFFVEDDLALALRVGADGLYRTDARDLAGARARLGAERILGVACGISRHRAMEAGEAGADFVAFGASEQGVGDTLLEMVRWWSEVFVLPGLALGARNADEARLLAQAGADFVGAAGLVWEHPDGVVAGVAPLLEAIGQA